MWIYLVVIILVLLAIYQLPFWRCFLAGCRIPGPPAVPLFGNVFSISSNIEKQFDIIRNLHPTYGSVVRLWIGPFLGVLTSDAADVQAILGNSKTLNRDYFISLPFLKIMGNSLAVSRDDEWRTHRKLLTTAFHYKAVTSYCGVFSKHSEQLVERLAMFADGRTFDPVNLLGLTTMSSIRDSIFGSNLDWHEDDGFMEAMKVAGDVVATCFTRPWFVIDWIFQLTRNGKLLCKMREEINKRSSMVIKQKLEAFKNSKKTSTKETRPFVDFLIEASEMEGSIMSIEEFKDELVILVLAAIETSATTLACFLTLMGIFPDIQRQVLEEVKEIFGTDTRRPTPDDLTRMTVTERCLKETLRMFPSVPFINREIGEDLTLPSGYVIPKGTTAIVFAYAVHRNPENYIVPDTFWPDRWLPENCSGRHPYAFVPFGAGKRNCIGHKYAYLQMKTVISSIFRKYRITSTSTMKCLERLGASPIVRPIDGYKIQIHELKPEQVLI